MTAKQDATRISKRDLRTMELRIERAGGRPVALYLFNARGRFHSVGESPLLGQGSPYIAAAVCKDDQWMVVMPQLAGDRLAGSAQ